MSYDELERRVSSSEYARSLGRGPQKNKQKAMARGVAHSLERNRFGEHTPVDRSTGKRRRSPTGGDSDDGGDGGEGTAMAQSACSATVRALHERLAARVTERLAASPEMSPTAAWTAALEEVGESARKEYATAMAALSRECWGDVSHSSGQASAGNDDPAARVTAAENSTHDRRMGFVLETLRHYFLGNTPEGRCCGLAAAELKERRRAFFRLHQQVMPAETVAVVVKSLNESHAKSAVTLLDVGSCNGLLEAAATALALPWLTVRSLDLCPAHPVVLRCDWLTVAIGVNDDVDAAADASGTRTVTCVAARSVDAVLMCYMLSFLPLPALRWAAIAKAAQVLRPGGLLIVLEPRRGAHSKGWPQRWAAALAALGFHDFRLTIMKQSVAMVVVAGTTQSILENNQAPLLTF